MSPLDECLRNQQFFRNIKRVISTPLVLLLSQSVAHADSDALLRRIATLENELNLLKKQVAQQDSQSHDSAVGRQNVQIQLKPTPKIKDRSSGTTFKIIGFGQVDAVAHDDDSVDHPDGTTIPRARLGIAGKFMDDWGYKFLYDFGNRNNPQLQDLFITYRPHKTTQLKIGQFKEPFGLEWQTPSKYWAFTELPLTAVLTPRRSIGLGVTHNYGQFHSALAVFGENANKTRTDDEGKSVDFHLSWMPYHAAHAHAHTGVSLSYRKPDQVSNAVTYSAKHETSTAQVNTLTTGSISNVDSIFLTGFEALGIYGPGFVQAEYVMSDIDRDYLDNQDFDAFYAQAGVMLTGESKKYLFSKHMFARVKPLSPFSLKNRGCGAWELLGRYEHLNLSDTLIQAGRLNRYTLGLNWYPNNYLKFSLNYLLIDSDNSASIPNDDTQSVILRSQIDF